MADPEELLARLAADLVRVLGGELFSLAPHGSWALGDFTPGRSDLDVLAVLATDPTAATQRHCTMCTHGSPRTSQSGTVTLRSSTYRLRPSGLFRTQSSSSSPPGTSARIHGDALVAAKWLVAKVIHP